MTSSSLLIVSSFKSHCIETWLVLVLDLAISSLSLCARFLVGLSSLLPMVNADADVNQG